MGGDGFAGRKVLGTGGLGFIGSNLAQRLASMGAEVVLVDSQVPNQGGNHANLRGFADQIMVHLNDLRDTDRLAPLVEGAAVIFNLAGQTSHLDSMLYPGGDLELNCAA